MGRKIGIFGGTFDPVHIGHVALVVALKEAHDLDSVFIIPANFSPHKKATIAQEAKHRLSMLKIAFKELPYCQILPIDVERSGPSYTIDTLHLLKSLGYIQQSDTPYLMLGQDQLKGFNTWKNVEELMKQTKALVARRRQAEQSDQALGNQFLEIDSHIQKWVSRGMTDTPYFEVSATDIRNRISKKLYCGHFLNNLVYNYIQRKHLYE